MSHIGAIVVAVVGIPVFLAIVLSLGRSIRRAGRMDPGSTSYVPLDQGAEHRNHGGGPSHGGHSHHHGGHGGGGHIGGGHVGGGHHG